MHVSLSDTKCREIYFRTCGVAEYLRIFIRQIFEPLKNIGEPGKWKWQFIKEYFFRKLINEHHSISNRHIERCLPTERVDTINNFIGFSGKRPVIPVGFPIDGELATPSNNIDTIIRVMFFTS